MSKTDYKKEIMDSLKKGLIIDPFPDTDTIMNFCRENETRGKSACFFNFLSGFLGKGS